VLHLSLWGLKKSVGLGIYKSRINVIRR